MSHSFVVDAAAAVEYCSSVVVDFEIDAADIDCTAAVEFCSTVVVVVVVGYIVDTAAAAGSLVDVDFEMAVVAVDFLIRMHH